jgi:hypothetical protein
MAKIQHLYSVTSGDVPPSLLRGQIAIDFPDQIVYANTPGGTPTPISSGAAGLSNASSYLGVHIPNNFMPACQLGPGMTQSQLQALFVDNGTTATYSNIPIFALGLLIWTGTLTCPSSAGDVYAVTINLTNRTAVLGPFTPTTNSGSINYTANSIQIVVYSNSTIYPWFYIPQYSPSGTAVLLRISPTQTFGAIPVSAGFAGAAATSYWGVPA